MNAKLGGRNAFLVAPPQQPALPGFSEKPTILFGADVTHPPPGAQGLAATSVAAVVASMDSFAARLPPAAPRLILLSSLPSSLPLPLAHGSREELDAPKSRPETGPAVLFAQASYSAEMVMQGERKEIIGALPPL